MTSKGKMPANMAPDLNILKRMTMNVGLEGGKGGGNDDKSLATMMTNQTGLSTTSGDNFDPVSGWEHDPKKMEIKFSSAVLNWKGHLPKLKEDILKIYAFYKQATVGDAPPIEDRPFETNAKEKWEVWNRWRGTQNDVAKRRYIT